MNKQFVAASQTWVLLGIYDMPTTNLFNQGGYSINQT